MLGTPFLDHLLIAQVRVKPSRVAATCTFINSVRDDDTPTGLACVRDSLSASHKWLCLSLGQTPWLSRAAEQRRLKPDVRRNLGLMRRYWYEAILAAPARTVCLSLSRSAGLLMVAILSLATIRSARDSYLFLALFGSSSGFTKLTTKGASPYTSITLPALCRPKWRIVAGIMECAPGFSSISLEASYLSP